MKAKKKYAVLLLVFFLISINFTHLLPPLLNTGDTLSRFCYIISPLFHLSQIADTLYSAPKNWQKTPGKVIRDRVNRLEEPLIMSWYRTSSFLAHESTALRTETILNRLATLKNVHYAILPVETLAADERFQNLGITSRPSSKGDLSSALVVEYNGFSRTIPYLSAPETLEYDLYRIIDALELQSNRDPLPSIRIVYGGERPPADFPHLLSWFSFAGFGLIESDHIPKNMDIETILLVLGSSELLETDALHIKEFRDGGKAIFLISTHKVDTSLNWEETQYPANYVSIFLQELGIRLDNGIVWDQECFTLTLPELEGNSFIQIPYSYWPVVKPNTSDQLFAGINKLHFFWPSSISILPNAPENIRTLIQASSRSALEAIPVQTNPLLIPQKTILRQNRETPILGVIIPENPALIVLSDELFVSGMINYTGSSENLDFLVQCAESLSGRSEHLVLKEKSFLPLFSGFVFPMNVQKKPLIKKSDINQTTRVDIRYNTLPYTVSFYRSLVNNNQKLKTSKSENDKELWNVVIGDELEYEGNTEQIHEFLADLTNPRFIRSVPNRVFDQSDENCRIELFNSKNILLNDFNVYTKMCADGEFTIQFALDNKTIRTPEQLRSLDHDSSVYWTRRDFLSPLFLNTEIAQVMYENQTTGKRIHSVERETTRVLSKELKSLRSVDVSNIEVENYIVLKIETEHLDWIQINIGKAINNLWIMKVNDLPGGWIITENAVTRISTIFGENL